MEKEILVNEYLKIDEYLSLSKFTSFLLSINLDSSYIDCYIDAINKHNKDFIISHLNDPLFNNLVSGITFDNDQKKVILSTEDYLLVVASAGSGKTTVIEAKVNYLIKHKGVKPREILIITYTNKAVNELKNRLKEFNDIDIKTFHSLALSIIKSKYNNVKLISDNALSTYLKYYIDNVLFSSLALSKFLNYMTYHNVVLKNSKYLTLDKKVVKDDIIKGFINYLYLEGIKYLILSKRKILLIDKRVIIIIVKSKVLKRIGSTLIIGKDQDYIGVIKSIFNKKIEVDNTTKYKLLISNNDYINSFISLMKTYHNLYLENNCEIELDTSDKILFHSIYLDFFTWYSSIKISGTINLSFTDMINMASTLLYNNEVRLHYNNIMVDEYQDISISRNLFLLNLRNNTLASLLCVGDDYQSIYGFSGSNVSIFLNFKKYFKGGKILYLNTTYRFSQEMCNISNKVVLRNQVQIRKNVKSYKHLKNPLQIYFYNDLANLSSVINSLNSVKLLTCILDKIIKNVGDSKILILSRYSYDVNIIIKSNMFTKYQSKLIYKKSPSTKIYFLTIHEAKGLTFDEVIIFNVNKGIYGFPSMIKSNKLLPQSSIEEERRLLYVAITRSRYHTYLISNINTPSVFIFELLKSSNLVVHNTFRTYLKYQFLILILKLSKFNNKNR